MKLFVATSMSTSTWLQLVGLIVEILGAAVLGYAFVSRVHPLKMPWMFLLALLGTKRARGYAAIAPGENRSSQIFHGLRGSALLWIGFVLQLLGLLTQRPS